MSEIPQEWKREWNAAGQGAGERQLRVKEEQQERPEGPGLRASKAGAARACEEKAKELEQLGIDTSGLRAQAAQLWADHRASRPITTRLRTAEQRLSKAEQDLETAATQVRTAMSLYDRRQAELVALQGTVQELQTEHGGREAHKKLSTNACHLKLWLMCLQ